jgi:26S proteasome regulatory subunit N6
MAETFAEQLTKKLNEANEAEEAEQTGNAIKLYEQIIKEAAKESDDLTEEAIKTKETATYKLANIYKEKGLVNELIELQKSVLPLFIDFPKSKTAKIMRTLFDLTLKLEGHYQELIELCKFIIQWCESESRSFLRMRIETNLADLYFKIEKYQDAI